MSQYIVVFEKSKRAGPYEGTRSWISYSSKEDFNLRPFNNHDTPIAQGVSEDEAIALCNETPMVAYIRAYYHESTDSETKQFDEMLFISKCAALSPSLTRRQAEELLLLAYLVLRQ